MHGLTSRYPARSMGLLLDIQTANKKIKVCKNVVDKRVTVKTVFLNEFKK